VILTFVVIANVSQPWQIKYRISEHPERILSAQLESLNDHLRVREKGLYEILEVGFNPILGWQNKAR
jgi:hypothetical protein